MAEWVEIKKDHSHLKREKEKARQLRKSQWWKNKLVQGICHYCGKKFPATELTMDHIVPLARGGKSTKGNCVVCCKDCNNQKKYYTPVEIKLDKISAMEKDTGRR